MREETNDDRFFATAGRTAEKLGQGQKLSQREFRQTTERRFQVIRQAAKRDPSIIQPPHGQLYDTLGPISDLLGGVRLYIRLR
jgi:hypothetical protein